MIKRPWSPVSASEHKTYTRCQRLWAAQYMSELWPAPERPTGMFALGTAFHGVIEKYLDSTVMPHDASDPLTEMFVAALPFLPKPYSGLTEQKWSATFDGVPWGGAADYVSHDRKLIVDFKTGKTPRRYGTITRAQKLADVQTVAYCAKYIGEQEAITFDHLYVEKHKAAVAKYEGADKARNSPVVTKAFNTPVLLSREELGEAWAPVSEAAQRLYSIRSKGAAVDPASMPFPDPSTGACDEYGGCVHKDRCFPGGDFRCLDVD